MSLHRRPLRSLSAALVFSTALTAPALAADQTLLGALTGPITVDAPIDTLTNSATITASTGAGALTLGGAYPDRFKKVINTGTITATGATTDGISAPVAVEQFLNSGSIVSDDLGIYFGGLFLESVTNEQGGLIEGDNAAVEIYYGVNTFVNAGTLRSTGGNAITGFVRYFTNTATGQISAAQDAVLFSGTTFNNSGLIESTGAYAGVKATGATTFNNNAGGTIRSTSGTAVAFNDNTSGGTLVTTFTNNGTLRGATSGASFTNGSVGTFINGTTGKIYGGGDAVIFNGNVSTFENSGWIEATGSGDGVSVIGTTGTFTNQTGATIKSATGKAVDFDGAVTTFVNNGTIESGYMGIDLDSPTGTFINTGTIKGGTGWAIDGSSYRIDTFANSGTISASASGAIHAGSFGSFSNSGTIESVGGRAVEAFNARTETFFNSGTIRATDLAVDLGPVGTFTNAAGGVIESSGNNAVWLAETTDSFVNRGRIAATAGTASGVHFNDTVGSFINSGTISSYGDAGITVVRTGTGPFINEAGGTLRGEDYGAFFYNGATAFENRGLVTGWVGMGFSDYSTTAAKVINSGTIQGVSGVAIDFGANNNNNALNDVLQLRTGSRILGSIDFANGNDTLDISGFSGNAVLTVAGLETLTTGRALVNDQRDGSGNGTVSVLDATGITQGGPVSLGEVAGAISGEIAGALGGQAGSFAPTEPLGYAPSRPVGGAEAAADELVASTDPTGPAVWGKIFGGIANKSNEYNAVLGGIIAGSHTAVDARTRLGGVVSLSGSRFVTAGNGQTVTATIGAAGLYGSTDLDGLTLSYSVLGGLAANHSDRSVTAAVTETARADFASWFLSPELGISIPVPLLEGTDTAVGFKLRYVGGQVGSYTETGSSQNLTVGTAAVNLLDARAEVTSKTQIDSNDFGAVMLYATAGVLAQQNFGSSVSISGFPIATTPASFAYGGYGDLTLDAPIGPTSKISASAGVEIRSDGASSASTNLGLTAAF